MNNPDGLREISRVIASVVIFSSDDKLLMGRKDPAKGGVYINSWHLPGGGVEPGESLEAAARREATQEITGLDLSHTPLVHLPFVDRGGSTKTLETGEKVWCNMQFNRFEIRLGKTAAELVKTLIPGDDLVQLRWFAISELATANLVPGSKTFFIQAGYTK